MDTRLRCMMNTYDYESTLFITDPNMKELYIQFSTRHFGNLIDLRIDFDGLINHYLRCGNSILSILLIC